MRGSPLMSSHEYLNKQSHTKDRSASREKQVLAFKKSLRVEEKKCLLFFENASQNEKYIDFAWLIGRRQKHRGKR